MIEIPEPAVSAGFRPFASRAHRKRTLVVAFTASLLAHVAALALITGLRAAHEPLLFPRPLEVVLVRPVAPIAAMPEAAAPPKRVPQSRDERAPHPRIANGEPPGRSGAMPINPLPQSGAKELVWRPKAVQPDANERLAPTPAPSPEPKTQLAMPQHAPAPAARSDAPQSNTEARPASVEPEGSAAVRTTAPAAAPSAARNTVATVPPSFNASYLHNAPPIYPLVARRNGIEGSVRLKVLVTREGRAAQVQVEQSSGSPALDDAALDAVRKWQFIPARRGQEPIESWVLVPVMFKLENAS